MLNTGNRIARGETLAYVAGMRLKDPPSFRLSLKEDEKVARRTG